MRKTLLAITLVGLLVIGCKKEKDSVEKTKVQTQGSSLVNKESSDSSTLAPESLSEVSPTQSSDLPLPAATTGSSMLPTSQPNISSAPVPAMQKPMAIQKLQDGKYVFGYRLQKGKSYPMTIKKNEKATISDGKQSATNQEVSSLKRTFTVKDVTQNGTYIVEVKQGRTTKSVTMPNGQKITLNSGSKPSQKPLQLQWKMLQAEIQTPLTLEMTPLGKIVSIKGVNTLRSKLKSKVKSDLSAEEFKAFEKGLEVGYSEQAKIFELEQNLAIFPTKPVAVGKPLTESDSKSEGGGKLKVNSSLTLSKVANGTATVNTKSTSSISGSQSKDGLTVNSNGSQNTSGEIVFDQETGWVKTAKLSQKQTTKETQKYEGQSATGTQTVTTTVTVN